jgi:hypothetical protein
MLLDVKLDPPTPDTAYLLDKRWDEDEDDTVETGRVWLLWNYATANVVGVFFTRKRAVDFAHEHGLKRSQRRLIWDVERRRVQA